MKIVTVVPLKKGLWKENLTYFSVQDVPNGSIVSVPLRSKKVLGLVINVEDARSTKGDIKSMPFNLKKISGVKEHSIFRKEYLEAVLDASRYFAGSKNNTITSLIPAVWRENYDAIAKFDKKEKIFGALPQNELKSEKFLFQVPLEDRISAYKTLIRGSFAAKKSVFMVLPTEHDIETFEGALSKGIEQFAFAFHGNTSGKKNIKKFKELMEETHPVLILGTAPYLSIPRSDIGTIILEHESSGAYKMMTRPHIDLRLFAELFAAKISAKFILADTLLRFESIARVEEDGFVPFQPLSFRLSFEGDINISGVGEKFKVLHDESIEKIKKTLEKKKNVFIFSLRKGLATMTICRDCSDTLSCNICGAPLVLYMSADGKKRIFACNRCEREVDTEIKCATCGSWNLLPLGIGTDTVHEEVKKLFPKIKIFQLDKESAKTGTGAEKIIKEFDEGAGSVLIGTEMAFFYLKNKVALSVVSSFDSLWSIPSFKMGERISQIIHRMLEITKNKLIIQTKNDTDTLIEAVKAGNLLSFIREEISDRKSFGYPPYNRFIKITFMGNKDETGEARRLLKEIFKEFTPEIFSGFIAKQKDKYVTNALLKLSPKDWSLPEISAGSYLNEDLLARLMTLPQAFEIFVDPEDLL